MSQLFGASFSLDPQLLVFFVGTVPKISNVYETLFNDLAHKVTVLVSVCRLFIDCERATVCASVCVCRLEAFNFEPSLFKYAKERST